MVICTMLDFTKAQLVVAEKGCFEKQSGMFTFGPVLSSLGNIDIMIMLEVLQSKQLGFLYLHDVRGEIKELILNIMKSRKIIWYQNFNPFHKTTDSDGNIHTYRKAGKAIRDKFLLKKQISKFKTIILKGIENENKTHI